MGAAAASAYEAPIFNGDPGKRWRNETGRIQFQLICDLHNSCGTCLQFHMAIGSSWPIPFHRRCRCHQVLIKPGGLANPFVDFRKILDAMPHEQRAKAVGSSVYELLRAKVIGWDDAVSPTRVRDLQEVVWKKKLTVQQMTRAGVKPRWAQEAYDRAHSNPANLLQDRRAELLAKIRGAGMSDDQIRQAVKDGLARRFKLSGPSGPSSPIKPGPAAPTPPTKFPLMLDSKGVVGKVHGQDVADILGGTPTTKPASAAVAIAGDSSAHRAVGQVVADIAKLHDIPATMPTIPLTVEKEAHNARYVISLATKGEATPLRINVNPEGSHLALSTAHEIGHFLDHAAIPGNKAFDRKHAKDELFAQWAEAVKASPSIRTLAETKARLESRGGAEKAVRRLSYLLQGDEVWARSYAQWVAVRSGNQEMLDELAAEQTAKQWGTKEFEPIAEAIDGIFRKLGLLKRPGRAPAGSG